MNHAAQALGSALPNYSPASTDGIVASSATMMDIATLKDLVFVPSGDGNLYAVTPSACGLSSAADVAATMRAVPGHPGLWAPDAALAAAHYGPGWHAGQPGCLKWVYTMVSPAAGPAGTSPIYAPPRWVPKTNGFPYADGIVIASMTDLFSGEIGTMYGLIASTGVPLWNISALYVDSTGATINAIIRTVPAISQIPRGPTQTYLGFAAWGNVIVCFDAFTGQIYNELSNNGRVTPGTDDLFVSSPTLSLAETELYVHSTSGALWKATIDLSGWPANPPIMKWAWSCVFELRLNGDETCTTFPPNLDGAPAPAARFAGDGRDYVYGGFAQPTTRSERKEHADVPWHPHSN